MDIYFFSLLIGMCVGFPVCMGLVDALDSTKVTGHYLTRLLIGTMITISGVFCLFFGIEPWMAIQLAIGVGLMASYSKQELKNEATKQFRLEVAHGYRKDIPIPAAMQIDMRSVNTLPVVIQPQVYMVEVAPVVLVEARV